MKKLFIFALSLFLCFNLAFTQSAKLDTQEVEVMKVIWGKLGLAGKKELDLEQDPCSGKGIWGVGVGKTGNISVGCNCSFASNTACRVTQIVIISQNVSADVPSEFTKLAYLQVLDLSLNYLSGAIPSEWVTMRLKTLSLMGNRLSGPFPSALIRMITLLELDIETNHFSGPIPEGIANLIKMRRLVLSSNDFTGQLSAALAKLTNLTELRISGNNFTGKIPNYISQWRQIEILHIQGCSFEGPIPSGISVLTQLYDLRISDLKVGASTFPSLEKLSGLNTLILRNCLIHGKIPDYFGNFRSLITLDLSFNNMSGEIPSSFSLLGNAEYIYLTENNLSGRLPGWVSSSTKNVDVSYNNFTWEDASSPKRCEEGKINVVESYTSSTDAKNNIDPCLRKDFPCTQLNAHQIYSLHINCGGEEVNINKTIKYADDTEKRGASSYYNGGNWAFSSTGNFLDVDGSGVFILSNTSDLNISTFDTELYKKARTAAISLTYYGLCLMSGNYTVTLHFAEIVFTQDNSFNSLGRRVFDVYVQGRLKLKEFDVVKEAGGIGRAVTKSYTVNVKNNTLKIQLYWAGKGTTGIPFSGSYGPIISAISVNPSKYVLTNHI